MQNKSTEKRGMRSERPQITSRTKVYIVIAASVLGAIKTIIPFPYESKTCILVYKSGCSFASISTVILIVGADVTYFVAKRNNTL